MSDVVFILGAGASASAGAPVMADFLDQALRLLQTDLRADKREHFQRVFSAIGKLQQVHSKAALDITNLESIFTAFELGDTIGKLPGIDHAKISELIDSLKAVIVDTLEAKIRFPTYGREVKAPTDYSKFAQLVAHLKSEAYPLGRSRFSPSTTTLRSTSPSSGVTSSLIIAWMDTGSPTKWRFANCTVQ